MLELTRANNNWRYAVDLATPSRDQIAISSKGPRLKTGGRSLPVCESLIEINAEIAVRENLVPIAQKRTRQRMKQPQLILIGGSVSVIVDVEELTADL